MKNSLKRFNRSRLLPTALLLIVLLAMAAFPGAVINARQSTTSLIVWDQETGPYGDLFDKMNAAFEAAHPGVKIERSRYTLDDLMNALPLAMTQPDAPDVAQVNQGQTSMGRLVKAGLLLPLDDYATKYGWDKLFSEGLLARNRFTDKAEFGVGHLLGISVSAEIVGVYWNKKIFKANGVEVPKTFEDFEALLKKFKDKGVVPLAMATSGNAIPGFHVFSAIQHLKVTRQWMDDFIFGRNNVSFDIPENQQAAEIAQNWAKAGYYAPGYEGVNSDDLPKTFVPDKTAMMLSGNWYAAQVVEAGKPGDYGFFALPGFGGKSGMTIGGPGIPFGISKSSKNPDLAAEYINYLVSQENADRIASIGQLPARAISKDVKIDPLLKDMIDVYNEANSRNAVGHYIDWAAPKLFEELGAGTQELFAGRITPKEFTARMQKVYADYLASRK
jgi:raffinose/stachyose/melibiose transport system substrate-binding protein